MEWVIGKMHGSDEVFTAQHTDREKRKYSVYFSPRGVSTSTIAEKQQSDVNMFYSLRRLAHRQVRLNITFRGTSDFRSCLPCMWDCHKRKCVLSKDCQRKLAHSCLWIPIHLHAG